MPQKITSTSHHLKAATSSTKTDGNEKRRYQSQQDSRRQGFAKHLEAKQSEQRGEHLQAEQHTERDALLTRHEVRQIGEESMSTRHEHSLEQGVRARDDFEQHMQGESAIERTSSPEENQSPDSPDAADSGASPTREQERTPAELRPVEGVQEADAAIDKSSDVQETSDAASPQDVQEIARMAEQLVKACSVGEDRIARKVMLLDVEIPGKGQMRVRLTRDGDGVNVRLRASNDTTRAWLKSHQGRLRDHAASQGVVFKHIEVV